MGGAVLGLWLGAAVCGLAFACLLLARAYLLANPMALLTLQCTRRRVAGALCCPRIRSPARSAMGSDGVASPAASDAASTSSGTDEEAGRVTVIAIHAAETGAAGVALAGKAFPRPALPPPPPPATVAPLQLEWQGLSVAYRTEAGLKPVLQDVWGRADPGELQVGGHPVGSRPAAAACLLADTQIAAHDAERRAPATLLALHRGLPPFWPLVGLPLPRGRGLITHSLYCRPSWVPAARAKARCWTCWPAARRRVRSPAGCW